MREAKRKKNLLSINERKTRMTVSSDEKINRLSKKQHDRIALNVLEV